MTQRRSKIEVWDSIALDLISIQVEGKLVFINAAGAKMLGATTPESLLGKPMLDFVHPDYREIAAERVHQLTDEGVAISPCKEKWLKLDGTAIDVEVAAMPVTHKGEPAVQLIVRKNDQRVAWRSTRIRHPLFRLRR